MRFYGPADSWELYDLVRDPQELKNRYNDPGYVKIIADLRVQLRQLIAQYDDREAAAIMEKGPQ